mmetsp:Transcript_13288/g.24945  ORF Transcript_13288/g.24945 Transcript_13288/m.24945 type:complete len:220 (-) Transcript_13288:543-1202(-)
MGKKSKKNSAVKKKRISKHVLRSKEQETAATSTTATSAAEPQSQSSSGKKKKQKEAHIKDPSEAANYLILWKTSKQSWKFNKNTQSWLIRHMYEADKVPKATFSLLLEYLLGAEGNTRDRIRTEAARRARRYKEHSNRSTDQGDDMETKTEASNTVDNEERKESAKTTVTEKPKEGAKDGTSKELSPGDDEEARWRKLDEHDKRKEYKRARKVLDLLKV